jgi:heme A synthase
MIGAVSFALPVLVMIIGCRDLTSISASYHTASRDLFVASLAAVGMLMIPYQGKSGSDKTEYWASKIGGVAAIVVAFVPTACPGTNVPTFSCLVETACDNANETVHISAAIVVFASLFWLCLIFRKRAFDKFKANNYMTARVRAHIYELCMAGILLGALLVGLYKAGIKSLGDTALFWGEAIMLFSFSIAWLTASKIIIWDGKRPTLLPIKGV